MFHQFMKESDLSHVIFAIIILIKGITSSNMFLQFMKEIGHLHVKFVMMSDLEENKA